MFLTKSHKAFAFCLGMCLTTGAQAFTYKTLIGIDAWDIDQNYTDNRGRTLLYLADSTPQWTYRNPNAWLRFDGAIELSEYTTGRFKFRGDQSSDWRLDELNLDWKISPSLGLNVGVVDYKTSWCRTYDVDSTWVRENDPFCTVQTTNQATGSAPGLQILSNRAVGNQHLQAKLGLYNPLLLNHDTQEFNNQPLRHDGRVTKNNKVGVSVSSIHVLTATEWRLSYLYTDQEAEDRSSLALPKFKRPQQVGLWYIGLGFDVTDHVRARITHLHSELNSTFTDSFSSSFDNSRHYRRLSSTAELQWRVDGLNRIGLAYSVYTADTHDNFKRKGVNQPRFDLANGHFSNTSWSVSWRRDWSKNMYSALQWTEAAADEQWAVTGRAPFDRRSSGQALGLRLGWRY